MESFVIDTLLKGIKPFRIERIEFEERASKDFGNGFDWLSKLNCQNEIVWLFTEMLHSTQNAKYLLEVLMREIIPVVSEKLSLKSEVHKLKIFLLIFADDEISEAIVKTTAFSIETYLKV